MPGPDPCLYPAAETEPARWLRVCLSRWRPAFLLFHQIGDLVAGNVAVQLFQIRVSGQDNQVFRQLIVHMRGAAFHRLAVVLHLVEGGRVAVTINDLFALLATRTGNDHFISVNFDGALRHHDVTREGDDVTLHIEGLSVRLDVDRLVGIARYSKRGRLAASIALAIITLRLSLFVLNFIGGSNLFNQLGVLAA